MKKLKATRLGLISCIVILACVPLVYGQNPTNEVGFSFTVMSNGADKIIRAFEGNIKPIYEVDGKRVGPSQLGVLPDDIKSVGILKPVAAIGKYGDEVKFGAIHIYTFAGDGPDPSKIGDEDPLLNAKSAWESSAYSKSKYTWDQFLVIINGEKSDKVFSELGLRAVTELTITVDEETKKKYNACTKLGVLFIKTNVED